MGRHNVLRPKSSKNMPADAGAAMRNAYLVSQPRGVRIFSSDLRMLWDNLADRADRFPIFPNSKEAPTETPSPGPQRDVWPVQMVSRGESAAWRLYKAAGERPGEDRWFRVSAYRMAGGAGEEWVVEETEEVESASTPDACLESIETSLDSVVRRLCLILSNEQDPASIQTIALPNARLRPCHEIKQCSRVDCPAYGRTDNLRCWEINRTFCPQGIDPKDALEKMRFCDECVVYQKARTNAKERIDENINRLLHLTRLKYKEAQDLHDLLQQSERVAATSEISLGVLHEIKNPLSVILGRLDCLALELKDLSLADISEDLNVIRSHALRMQRLSEGPLGLVHSGPGEVGPFSINDAILEVLAETRKTLDRVKIEIKVDLDPQIPRIFGNRPQIQQVLLNLVLNARDAMPNGGVLSVLSRHQEGSVGGVIVEMQDTGGGIPAEHQERIFTPFFSTKAKHEGLGLGLAISRRILQQHYGQITAQSDPNRGATFRIWLPAEDSDK